MHQYCYRMLTNVTFSLPDRTVKRLRSRAAKSGKRKGAISEMVDTAITSYLDRTESAQHETFTARRGAEAVATAGSLEELAAALRAKKVDWRSVEIVSSEPIEPVVHLGLRTRSA